ncbi:MAG: aldo/keto reductase [Candidatus Omnitrophota bacterium]
MRYSKIAGTDLNVSRICLGTWVFGGDCWGEQDDEVSIRVVRSAVENGINFIDTAPVYGSGRAENVVGRALSDIPGKVIIATKLGLEQKGRSIRPNLKADFIRQEIEMSLRRLRVEAIDLYQCHWPDPATPLEETFGELCKLKEEGKVRHIGVSNFQKDILERAAEIAPVVSDQMPYSLFNRSIEEDLMPFCRGRAISILSYGALGGGILSGKYKEPPVVPKGDVRSFFYKYYTRPFWDKAQKTLSLLKAVAENHHAPVSQAAISWVLRREEVSSCIVGCRNPEQLERNIKAADWELDGAEIKAFSEELE